MFCLDIWASIPSDWDIRRALSRAETTNEQKILLISGMTFTKRCYPSVNHISHRHHRRFLQKPIYERRGVPNRRWIGHLVNEAQKKFRWIWASSSQFTIGITKQMCYVWLNFIWFSSLILALLVNFQILCSIHYTDERLGCYVTRLVLGRIFWIVDKLPWCSVRINTDIATKGIGNEDQKNDNCIF